jgi:iron complex transport system substrate-binding protein
MQATATGTRRRAWLAGLLDGCIAGWLAGRVAPVWAHPAGAFVRDAAGREVRVPQPVRGVFPAGGPAAILLYTLAPDLLLGWPRANRAAELPFLLPGVGDRPELGRLTGRGNTANLEQLLAQRPSLIVDSGSTRDTYVDLANRVQAQTGIPYLLLDGRFEQISPMYRLLGRALGRESRAEVLATYAESTLAAVRARLDTVPAVRRPRVYYARGPQGLETGLGGSINAEILDWMGLRHFGKGRPGGLARVSVEEVLAWDPEVIVTIDRSFAATVRESPLWRRVSAVRTNRVHLSPKLPFGWVDFPPSVNRLPGLWWLGRAVHPEVFDLDLAKLTRDFYRLFYQVEPSTEQVGQVLDGRD